MRRSRLGWLWILMFCSVFAGENGRAQERPDLRTEIEAIESVEQVKTQIRELMVARDQCRVGSCHNTTSTSICEQVGMLDIRVDGKIFSGGTGWTDTVLPIAAVDLTLMKRIFSQCKPTNYQYWNWGVVLHVAYSPDCATDQLIRKSLGLSTIKRCRNS